MFIITSVSTCFGQHYEHLQENKGPVTAFGVLFWFCWMWLVAVVGRCVVGCEHCVLTSYNAAPHNRYQPHPAKPEQHTKCSNRAFVLLKMGIMLPETCWDRCNNKHLIVASCWFFLSSHFAHDARSQEPKGLIQVIVTAVSKSVWRCKYKTY